jgi:hypothetical protein
MRHLLALENPSPSLRNDVTEMGNTLPQERRQPGVQYQFLDGDRGLMLGLDFPIYWVAAKTAVTGSVAELAARAVPLDRAQLARLVATGGYPEVARTIHPHPAFAEAVMEAARATDGWLIHG